jgi:large conductance mechanosensitive channel
VTVFAEFRAFLLETNALALAIAVIIGVAAGAVVMSLVNDIIMPPIGMLLGNVDVSELKIVLQEPVGGDPTTEVAIRWGAFLMTVVNFVIVAFIVFWASRMLIKEPPADEVKTCPFCREANAVDASRCRACTSAI